MMANIEHYYIDSKTLKLMNYFVVSLTYIGAVELPVPDVIFPISVILEKLVSFVENISLSLGV